MTNFDQPIERIGSNSVKWDTILTMYNEDDLLPLWIADMDFRAPTDVLSAYQALLTHGVLGYTDIPQDLYTAIIRWERERHHLDLEKKKFYFFQVF